jgi:hypothetical protein
MVTKRELVGINCEILHRNFGLRRKIEHSDSGRVRIGMQVYALDKSISKTSVDDPAVLAWQCRDNTTTKRDCYCIMCSSESWFHALVCRGPFSGRIFLVPKVILFVHKVCRSLWPKPCGYVGSQHGNTTVLLDIANGSLHACLHSVVVCHHSLEDYMCQNSGFKARNYVDLYCESDWDYVNDDSRRRDTACVRAV